MGIWLLLGLGAVAAAVLAALWRKAMDTKHAETVWQALRATRDPAPPLFDPATLQDQPEIVRRFFAQAIAPGTPLHRVVEITMTGEFILNGRALPMQASQIMAPPQGFVWRAKVGRGLFGFSGADGYLAGQSSWMRFWLAGVVPLVRAGGTADFARSAAARMVLETLWNPAALLPQFGARWQVVGPDLAAVRFDALPQIEPVMLRIDAEGRITEAFTQRWSSANADKVYRLQPFGGHCRGWGSFHGFTIPTELQAGNFFGTPQFVPFFVARLTAMQV
ncbi:DUF6544 family protein [Rhodobacter ferrooxidans]|uniref:Uncharacterized protein n=1 Tax=Rhodobacter ferrooxidans TaxID=371731 RepID=C8RYL0_9RHOB|nr:DUF6544 family protein [Rhodobacter sp. SW2]EEW26198.1 conserved hypothetical protein [Rhodobacter sp. SW2]